MRVWWSVALAALLASGCNDEAVEEDVPPEVCVSGKRWVGGRRGSAEMYPGRDCVGCHLENDGPQLMAGGTIYAFGYGREGASVEQALGQPQATDCFGVEGVTVVLTGADGEEFRTVTNRAGNFYFEGRPSQLAKPYRASFEYIEPDGNPRSRPMTTTPNYGGCGRCHNPYSVPTDPQPPFGTPPEPEIVLSAAIDFIDLALPVDEVVSGAPILIPPDEAPPQPPAVAP